MFIFSKWRYCSKVKIHVLNVHHLSSVVKLLRLLCIVNIQHIHVLKWARLFRKSYLLQWNKNNSYLCIGHYRDRSTALRIIHKSRYCPMHKELLYKYATAQIIIHRVTKKMTYIWSIHLLVDTMFQSLCFLSCELLLARTVLND